MKIERNGIASSVYISVHGDRAHFNYKAEAIVLHSRKGAQVVSHTHGTWLSKKQLGKGLGTTRMPEIPSAQGLGHRTFWVPHL